MGKINPRVRIWLKVRGLGLSDIGCEEDGVRRVPSLHGGEQMWTIEYSEWVMSQWEAWATELGFKRGDGWSAHDNALSSGHTVDEFDAWLIGRISP